MVKVKENCLLESLKRIMNSAIPFSLFHFCNQTLTGYLARKKVWSYPRVCNSFIHPLYINPLTVSPAHELLASTCHASDQPLRIFPSEFTHSFLLFIDPSIIQNAPYFAWISSLHRCSTIIPLLFFHFIQIPSLPQFLLTFFPPFRVLLLSILSPPWPFASKP